MALMRLFYAVPVSGSAAAGLGHACAGLQGRPGWRWIDPANWHVTIAFLGDTDSALLPALARLGEGVIAGIGGSALRLSRLEWWPGRSRPRLLAAVAEFNPALDTLYAGLQHGLAAHGLPVERRPLRPHVTLARLTRAGASAVIAADAPLPALAITVPVRQLVLYRSEPADAGGSLYSVLWQGALDR